MPGLKTWERLLKRQSGGAKQRGHFPREPIATSERRPTSGPPRRKSKSVTRSLALTKRYEHAECGPHEPSALVRLAPHVARLPLLLGQTICAASFFKSRAPLPLRVERVSTIHTGAYSHLRVEPGQSNLSPTRATGVMACSVRARLFRKLSSCCFQVRIIRVWTRCRCTKFLLGPHCRLAETVAAPSAMSFLRRLNSHSPVTH